jgi:predicted nucleotidyltransferase
MAEVWLQEQELTEVRQILQRTAPRAQAWLFGSRATGRGLKPFSDLDLLLHAEPTLHLTEWADLREAFSASDLPWRVDLVDRQAVTPEFLALVEAAGVVPLAEAHPTTVWTLTA